MTELNMRRAIVAFVLLLMTVAFGCARDSGSFGALSVTTPLQTFDGWTTESAAAAGLDTVRLHNLLRRIDENEYRGIDGVIIVKDGRLVFDKYFSGYDFKYGAENYKGSFTHYKRNTTHNLASVTKSVTGILCGIAIDRKLIGSVDDKVSSYFPDREYLFTGGKENITLANLLTMTSGLQWNEQDVPYRSETNDIIRLFLVRDPLEYILSKPLANEPGTRWYYNGGGTNLVGQMIQRRAGTRLDYFADKFLFDSLNIYQSGWVYIGGGFVYCSGDLRLCPRDMAKIGQLVLDKGVWKGRRVVSAGWIEQMTAKHVSVPHGEGYGYQWWLADYTLGADSIHSYQASGWGGQRIIVLPRLRSVVVITGSNYTRRDPGPDMMYNYILPAIDSGFRYDYGQIGKEAPLPDNVVTTKPIPSIQTRIARLPGHWYGRWEGHVLSCQLAVGKIDSMGEATVAYSWGDHPDGYFRKGWVRQNVRIDSSGKFTIVAGDTLNFRFDPVEDVMVGNMKNKFVSIKTVLRRSE